jgi:peptidoglycan/xylan/chitin deacetylase (PgdA/CDA1 family)
MNPLKVVGNTWRKNWPEVRCGLSGGLPGFIFSKEPKDFDPAVPVFCYHVVDGHTFRADLSFLKHNGYTTLTADELLDHLESRKAAPPRSIVLSFDDGQLSLYRVAFPLLKEFNFKAVAFICPGLHRDRDADDARPDGGLCDWQQVREMHESGHVDFQPHTDGHRYVPRWPEALPLSGVDPAVADRRRPPAVTQAEDFQQSRDKLEKQLDKTAVHLAFPQYYGTDDAIREARQAGYRGFWWGVLPGRPMNKPGDPADRIVRVSGEFVRRLPGENRLSLGILLKARYGRRPRVM